MSHGNTKSKFLQYTANELNRKKNIWEFFVNYVGKNEKKNEKKVLKKKFSEIFFCQKFF